MLSENHPTLFHLTLMCSSPPTPLHPTYMHLRIELLGGGGGGVGPRHIVVGRHVKVTVDSVPAVGAGAPGQGGPK